MMEENRTKGGKNFKKKVKTPKKQKKKKEKRKKEGKDENICWGKKGGGKAERRVGRKKNGCTSKERK